ncbi:YraN family protein [Desulfurobacterium sp.]
MKRGYSILRRNFRTYCGEIDIIAFDSYTETLVFVEVKLRKEGSVTPEEAVTEKKIKRIRKAALEFLNLYRGKFKGIRFDVIGIEKGEKGIQINHVENAF